MKMEEEVKEPSDDILAKDGKLIVEYKGGRYELKQVDEYSYHGFHSPNKAIEHELNLAYSREEGSERRAARENMAYWYPQPYAIGKKAAESLGAKIIEYEDEVYKQRDDDGNPILY